MVHMEISLSGNLFWWSYGFWTMGSELKRYISSRNWEVDGIPDSYLYAGIMLLCCMNPVCEADICLLRLPSISSWSTQDASLPFCGGRRWMLEKGSLAMGWCLAWAFLICQFLLHVYFWRRLFARVYHGLCRVSFVPLSYSVCLWFGYQ